MVITTGFFDGVHLGHRFIIDLLVHIAKTRKEKSLVATFWPHPRTVLQDDARTLRLLNTLEEKQDLLYSLGVDMIEVIPFSKDFSNLSTEEYLEGYVKSRLGGTTIVLGYDNRVGSNAGTQGDIQSIAEKCGLEVIRADKFEFPGGIAVSSTKIRNLIAVGDVEDAAKMLGYDYMLHGVVVSGNRLGRTIGFPTANMELYEPLKLVPANGVYLVSVNTLGENFFGMCNIGTRPTVGKGNALTIETNIFDFNEDIYGLDMKIRFISKIRNEHCFDSMDSLKAQLVIDKNICLSRI